MAFGLPLMGGDGGFGNDRRLKLQKGWKWLASWPLFSINLLQPPPQQPSLLLLDTMPIVLLVAVPIVLLVVVLYSSPALHTNIDILIFLQIN